MIHPAGRTFHPSRHLSIYSNKSRSNRNSNSRSDDGGPQPFGCSSYGGTKLPFFFLFFWWVCFCGSNGGSANTTHRQTQRQTEERKRERRACVHKEKGVRPPAVYAASYNSSGDQLTLSNCLHLPFKLQNISVMTILFVKFFHNFFTFQVKQIYYCSHKWKHQGHAYPTQKLSKP